VVIVPCGHEDDRLPVRRLEHVDDVRRDQRTPRERPEHGRLEMGDFKPTGVNERLVQKVRDALDVAGHGRVRIVVSGGFTAEKIESFERQGVPVDAYGVGSSLIRGSNDFTGDIVITDGKPSAKVGRHYRENPRLELVT
jgi:nicotinate phosphoribosyltransferase